MCRPGTVVANDTFADAGIWAPYKAGVRILVYRSPVHETSGLAPVVLSNIARLDHESEAAAAMCELGVRYVYYGARASSWQERVFPPVEELRASPALEEVFRTGRAVVFAVHPACNQ
jgi:hypothetical protein